jgi:hypothetical protein
MVLAVLDLDDVDVPGLGLGALLQDDVRHVDRRQVPPQLRSNNILCVICWMNASNVRLVNKCGVRDFLNENREFLEILICMYVKVRNAMSNTTQK